MNNLRNKVQLIGNVGEEVEYLHLSDGKPMARVPISTKEVQQNAHGEKVVEIQWHHLVGWGETAEFMNVLLKKGKEVAIQGKLKHHTYRDEGGNNRFYSEIIVSEFMLLS